MKCMMFVCTDPEAEYDGKGIRVAGDRLQAVEVAAKHPMARFGRLEIPPFRVGE